MHWSQTESSKWSCNCLLRDPGPPFKLCLIDLMVETIGFCYEPILAFPARQGCAPESYKLVATFLSPRKYREAHIRNPFWANFIYFGTRSARKALFRRPLRYLRVALRPIPAHPESGGSWGTRYVSGGARLSL